MQSSRFENQFSGIEEQILGNETLVNQLRI